MSDKAVEAVAAGDVSTTVPPVEMPPLAILTQTLLAEQKPDAEGLVHATPPAFDVRVSPAAVKRASNLLGMLLGRWEAQGGGCRVELPSSGRNATSFLTLGSDELGVQLAENVDAAKPITDPTHLTGNLALHISGKEHRQFRRRWSDTKSQRLEKLIAPFVHMLIDVFDGIRQERLDAECIARQNEQVRRHRQVSSRDASREFYWRQELSQHVDRWHEAQRIRAYIAAVRAAIVEGRSRSSDPAHLNERLEWATRYADSIDPLVDVPIREVQAPEHRNVPVAELDVTSSTRRVLVSIRVPDSDRLCEQKQDAVRAACNGVKFGVTWNEITRVLEALGYGVANREHASEWF